MLTPGDIKDKNQVASIFIVQSKENPGIVCD